MYTFLDQFDNEYGAIATIEITNAVNGEKSIKGDIYSNDAVLNNLDKGWRLRFQDEYFVIVYAKPKDVGDKIQLSFDAVHQFFWDFSKKVANEQLKDGSHTFQAYLDFIFKDTGYRYNLEQNVKAFEKQSFGYKSKLALFNDIISTSSVEFQVNGKVVRILEKTGTDLSTVVRKNFNMNELIIEKHIGGFITYQKGFGKWHNPDDHSKGRLEVEYESPLAKEFGRLEGEPVIDERYTDTQSLLARVRRNVEDSYTISTQIDLEDLIRAGYHYKQPIAGDYIMAINETLGFQEKLRIVSFTSRYDSKGTLISHKVTCNDIGSVKKQSTSYTKLSKSVSESNQLVQDALIKANKAMVTADGKNTAYFGTEFPLDNPKGSLTKGDIFYRKVGDRTLMYFWNGSDWEDNPVLNDVESFKKDIDSQLKTVTETMQRNDAEHQKGIDDLFEKAGVNKSLADEAKRVGEQAKLDAANALSKALDYKNEAIAEAQRLDTVERQATETKLATTKSQAVAEADKLVNDAKTTLETQISGANKAISDAKQALESQVSGISTEISKTNDTIKTLATKADVDKTNQRVTQAESSITQQAGQITQKANQSTVDTLSGRVKNAETSITQQANQIALKANTTDVNVLTNRVGTAEATLNIHSNQIALKASQSDVNSAKSRLQNAESSLTVQAGEIAQRVKTSDFNQAKQRLATAESKITQLGDKITTEISKVEGKIPSSIGGRNLLAKKWFRKGLSSEQFTLKAWAEPLISYKTLNTVLEEGKTYTLSFDWEVIGKSTVSTIFQLTLGFLVYSHSHQKSRKELNISRAVSIGDKGRFELTFVCPPLFDDSNLLAYTNRYAEGSNIDYDTVKFSNVNLVEGTIAYKQWLQPIEDIEETFSSVRTLITQTAEGQEQLSTKLTETQGKVTNAETRINQLVNDVSSKVSQTDFDSIKKTVQSNSTAITQNKNAIGLKAEKTYIDGVKTTASNALAKAQSNAQSISQTKADLKITSDAVATKVSKLDFDVATRRLTNAETTIRTQAGQIEQRLTKTQVEQAITSKGYATNTIVQNLVKETTDGFERKITETKGLIPTEMGGRNLILNYENRIIYEYNSPINVIRETDITVPEWGATNAHRLALTTSKVGTFGYMASGRTAQLGHQMYLDGTRYTGSIYLKNNGSTAFRVSINTVSSKTVMPGQSLRLSITDRGDSKRYVQFTFVSDVANAPIDFTYWHPQIEVGELMSSASPAPEDTITTIKFNEVKDTVDSHSRTIGDIQGNISSVVMTASGLLSRVNSTETGLTTVQSQLAGSWAVRNLTSSGTVLNQLNLNRDGSVKIDGKLVQITGTTYIQDGVITSAKIANLDAAKITTGTLNAANVNIVNLNANKLVGLDANFIRSKIEMAMIDWMKGKTITAQNNAMRINLNDANITFNSNATINFNSAYNALVRRKGTHTAFVHFNDVSASSDGGVGSLYASIGVTSSGDGINSQSSGRFAGLRAFRGARGTEHNATVDQVEIYGDRIVLKDDFSYNRGFEFRPTTLKNGDFIDMNYLVGAVRALSRCWIHWNNVSWNSASNDLRNAVVREYNNYMKDL